MSDELCVAALFRYPVKSLGGEALTRAEVGPRGIHGDRRWMLVDEAGRFVTRRECPGMARIAAGTIPGGIRLVHAEASIDVAAPGTGAEGVIATVWRDKLTLSRADPAADAFLSRLLGRRVALVYQPADSHRALDPARWPGGEVSLADGFPVLVTGEASLADLNRRLAKPVPMARFRPNVVVSGGEPWQEDRWRRIAAGALTLTITRACARCVVTTQDAATGARTDGNEPLTTLRAMGRRGGPAIYFGQNALAEAPGAVSIGDRMTVIEAGDSNLDPY